MLPQDGGILLVHTNGVLEGCRVSFGVVEARVKIGDDSKAVTAQLQAVGENADAYFTRIKHFIEIVVGGCISVRYVHLRKGGAIDHREPPSPVSVLDRR